VPEIVLIEDEPGVVDFVERGPRAAGIRSVGYRREAPE